MSLGASERGHKYWNTGVLQEGGDCRDRGGDLPVCDARLWSRPSMLQKWHGVGVALHNAKMPAF